MTSLTLALLIVFCELVLVLFFMTFFHARLDRRLAQWRRHGHAANWPELAERLQELRAVYLEQVEKLKAGANSEGSAEMPACHTPQSAAAALALIDILAERFCELGEGDATLFARTLDCLERGLPGREPLKLEPAVPGKS